jgi:exodeoxyribonuclease VII small subunit
MANEVKPRFEDALAQIEKIVADLERGEPALSAALGKYENGVKLLRQCYELLEEAEHSVALLTGTDEEGNPVTTPFDATATLARDHGTSASPGAQQPKSKPRDRTPISESRATPQDHDSERLEAPF